jgi:fructose-bisphosphate aldolase, class I
MGVGKKVRLNRLFSHPSGRLCSVAVDHFIGYQKGLPQGLIDLPQTIAAVVEGMPDAITMHKGAAMSIWPRFAGRIPLIVQAVDFTVDDSVIQIMVSVEEALRLGADALAVAIGVRGSNEGKFLKMLATAVEEAARWDFPIIAHIYPRDFSGQPKMVHDPENIAWAVRCGIECGADVIKVPYTGDPASYGQIVAGCPVPVVAAGGPKAESLKDALELMKGVVASGARGATIGRNIWGFPRVSAAVRAFLSVIHDGASPEKAMAAAGLT